MEIRVNPDHDVIDIEIAANSTGWIAVGISPNAGMEHRDFAVCGDVLCAVQCDIAARIVWAPYSVISDYETL